MELADLTSGTYPEVPPDAGVETLRAVLDAADVTGVLVETAQGFGVVTATELVGAGDETAARLAIPVPALQSDDHPREAARVLAENHTPLVPVVGADGPIGIVTRDRVLETGRDALGGYTVSELMTWPVLTVDRDATVGEVRNDLRENRVSRVPVVGSDGEPVGMVTEQDIAAFLVDGTAAPSGGCPDDTGSVLFARAVSEAMTHAVETTTAEATVAEVVTSMRESGVGGLVVTDPETGVVAGIITESDVLYALAGEEATAIELHVEGADRLRTTTRDDITDRFERFTDEYLSTGAVRVTVRITAAEGPEADTPPTRCVVRLETPTMRLVKTAECPDPENALSLCIHRLERNVVDLRNVTSAE